MGEFRYDNDDGIVTITMDMDGPVNSMNDAFWGLYSGAMDRIEATEGLKGVGLEPHTNHYDIDPHLTIAQRVAEATGAAAPKQSSSRAWDAAWAKVAASARGCS